MQEQLHMGTERVLRVGFRPLDKQRLDWLEEHFGARTVITSEVNFLDFDAIVAEAARVEATVVIVEPMNPEMRDRLRAALAGRCQLWQQTSAEQPTETRPWVRRLVFAAYRPVI